MAKLPSTLSQELLSKIAEAIQGIRFGSVQIVIHDSRVVQIEKSEKIRFDIDAVLKAGGDWKKMSRADQTPGGSR